MNNSTAILVLVPIISFLLEDEQELTSFECNSPTAEVGVVSHIEGEIVDDQDIKIVGNFICQPDNDPRPAFYFPLNGTIELSPLGKQTELPGGNQTAAFADDNELTPFGNAIGSMKYNIQPAGSNNGSSLTLGPFIIDNDFLMIAQPQYFNHDPFAEDGYNLKSWRMYHADEEEILVNPNGSRTGTNTYKSGIQGFQHTEGATGNKADYSSQNITPFVWQHHEWFFIGSDVEEVNGVTLNRLDGTMPDNMDEYRKTNTTEFPGPYRLLYFHQKSNGPQDGSADNQLIYSGQTIAYDVPHIIWISDDADINNATIREPLITKSWNKTEIVAKVRTGRFSDLNDAYLIITVGYQRGDLQDPKTAGYIQLPAIALN